MDNGDAAGLWEVYFADRSVENRNKLVEYYWQWVKKVANKKLPIQVHNRECGLDDAISSAVEPLIYCVEKYDPGRGVTFTAYAYRRISGAVADNKREWDYLSRYERLKVKAGKAKNVQVFSMAKKLPFNKKSDFLRDQTIGDTIPNPKTITPYQEVEKKMFWQEITRNFDLGRKLVTILYWRDGITMKEIGRALGCGGSR